jgi:hypothetical protein
MPLFSFQPPGCTGTKVSGISIVQKVDFYLWLPITSVTQQHKKEQPVVAFSKMLPPCLCASQKIERWGIDPFCRSHHRNAPAIPKLWTSYNFPQQVRRRHRCSL